jgi:SpoVK/Ycf46/Vps4 family AAA+-type ATPase
MASFFSKLFRRISVNIDECISAEMGYQSMARFRVHSKVLPSYRFVDLYRAIEVYCQTRQAVQTIESEHQEDLNSLLHGKRERWASRKIKRSGNTAWPSGPRDETFLPVDRFWICPRPRSPARDRLVIRLRYQQFSDQSVIEVASEDSAVGQDCLKSILEQSIKRSVYRNQPLEIVYEAGTKDEYGDIERPERLRILFKHIEPVDDKDIINDDHVRQILWRNVIDLHLRRDVLKANRVPIRRGVLLYGPPGTGKTYACRYLCGKLPETTKIIVTGRALLQVNAIFTVARMLEPSLLILEDVDLVFTSRKLNLYSSVLGDLLDQMDGLRPFEDIGFILTTNAIDRMEAAIKDRPGRVSQCIYFGPPKPELRERYLRHYLRRYESAALDVDKLVAASEGATQAFLKEWVHRSVQIASERSHAQPSGVELRNDDFSAAMAEMKRFSEGSTGRIIGFHAE